jgi:hypothetical protein
MSKMDPDKKTRRKFLKESAALALTTMAFPSWNNEAIALDAFQAMGTRVGEVTDVTANQKFLLRNLRGPVRVSPVL